jgi:hypothetical protein
VKKTPPVRFDTLSKKTTVFLLIDPNDRIVTGSPTCTLPVDERKMYTSYMLPRNMPSYTESQYLTHFTVHLTHSPVQVVSVTCELQLHRRDRKQNQPGSRVNQDQETKQQQKQAKQDKEAQS